MWNSLRNEPVAVGAAIRAVLLVFVSFGVNITTEQIATIMLASEAVLALITRQSVTPNKLAEERVAAGGSPTEPRNDK